MKKVICLFLCCFTFNSFATSTYWVGAGTITQNFMSAQSNKTGDKKMIDMAPAVLVGATLPFFFGMSFAPGIGYAKYFTKDNTTKSDIILQYHFTIPTSSMFQFRYGFSNYITKIGGDGTSLTLNNGTGTATFYTPNETKTSYTASADLAADIMFSSAWSARLQFSVMRFLAKSRKVTDLITLNYFF
jgi:hypothetical protein